MTAGARAPSAAPRGRRAVLAGFVALVALVLVLYALHPYPPRQLIEWIRSYPVFAPAVFVAAGAVATTLALPTGLPLNLAAGVIWGGFAGGGLTWLAASISAAAAFGLSRWFGAGVVERLTAKPALDALVASIEEHDLLFIALSRLNPIVPYAIASYLFGLTRVSFWRYMLATMIANAPAALLFAYMGENIGDIALPADAVSRIRAVGFLFTLVTLALLWRFALRRIRRGRGGDA